MKNLVLKLDFFFFLPSLFLILLSQISLYFLYEILTIASNDIFSFIMLMWPWLIVIGLLALSALFSSSELAIMWVPMYKIKKYINENIKNPGTATLLQSLREKSDRTLIAILIGNNLVNVALSIYAASLWDTILAQFALWWAVWFLIVSISITFLILFFGEIIPKVFAAEHALKFGMVVAPIIQWVIFVLFPLVWVLEQIISALKRGVWAQTEKVSKEDVDVFVEEGKKAWIFTKTESLIIHNFLEFSDRDVESVFQHRTNMKALPEETTLEDARAFIIDNTYSRIPLYREDKDQIVWLITLRDVLTLTQDETNLQKTLKSFRLKNIAKVPITASIFDVFLDMKKHGWHFAIVIDEFGGTAWFITFEDILEDLVGAIRDESDGWEDAEIVKIDPNTAIVQGDTIIRDVIDILGIEGYQIPEKFVGDISEEDTASYVFLEILKEFAKKWDIVSFGDIQLEVLKVNKEGDAIQKVKVSNVIEEIEE